MSEKVSVILPVKNGEKTIRKCIASLIGQLYKDIEVIIIDDGSTDKTQEIIDEFIKEDTRIISLKNSASGVSSARNCGIKAARGEYISFVDADDTVEENIYCLTIETMKKYKADMAVFDINQIDKNGRIHVVKAGKKDIDIIRKDCQKYILTYGGYACNKVIRREKLNNNLFNEKIFMCEDLLFWFEVARKVDCISYIEIPLYNYIISDTGFSQSKVNDRAMTFSNAYEKMLMQTEDKKLQDTIVYMWVNNIITHINRTIEMNPSDNKRDYLQRLRRIYNRCNAEYTLCKKQKLYYMLLKINPVLADFMYKLRRVTRKEI